MQFAQKLTPTFLFKLAFPEAFHILVNVKSSLQMKNVEVILTLLSYTPYPIFLSIRLAQFLNLFLNQ